MLKRLALIFGPVVVAAILVLTVMFVGPIDKHKHNLANEEQAAVSLSPTVFRQAYLKNMALSDEDHRFVPFFGSSEWNRMDAFHPAVLARAYHRNYQPFLLGQKGAEALTQYFGMQQIMQNMHHKQAVFFVSPQWFTKADQQSAAFQFYFSKSQALAFLKNQTDTFADRYAAKRLLATYPNVPYRNLVQKVADGQKLSNLDEKYLDFQGQVHANEDAFFSRFDIGTNLKKRVLPKVKELPQPYNAQALDAKAVQLGESQTRNNRFGILDNFFTNRIGSSFPSLKNAQAHFNYTQSAEYSDFQLDLDQLAKTHTNVIFVIPPVNSKWAKYTGLNENMYQASVRKIKHQLTSQGFNNILDLSRRGNEPYFMEDTIHLGWRGWLAFDKGVAPFLEHKQPAPVYHLNNHFISEDWNNFDPINNDVNTFK
ncbi:D-alanyl-lipoteichoic acid biosynthesis protein DltD [Periweissella ghanensis]|uniref:Protein DltD n=1 Tax=Periweissella ghanensis TaxID=467997 RepID=A0ABM8ZA47_9LACO|nr:D-alanyl-lipoteichoic acid biosynthesis protein DltD [Periweissella ghanensis]MCM0600868.1 D-alanyl-lipoteichoic acid biosynthesis protein DltD [Periweissella ghanensis]CAH0417715.1 Protein DltD [Periweissella ghanensis]